MRILKRVPCRCISEDLDMGCFLGHTDMYLSASLSFSTLRATIITLAPFSASNLPTAFPIP